MKHYLLISFFLLSLVSCINVKQIAKGNLKNNETYNFYFYSYTYVSDKNKKLFRNCKVFMTHIKDQNKKIKENIFWYSCDTMLPIKYVGTKGSTNVTDKSNFLIADTSMNYSVPITENERDVFEITNKYFSKEGYPTYEIKGFTSLGPQDSLARLPFLETTTKFSRP
jgi:hypothetical protein